MRFVATIQNGKIIFPPTQLALRARFLTTCKDGQRVEESLVKKSEPKTQEQLGYAFAVVIAMLMDYFNENGIDLFGCAPTRRFTKEILYHACAENDDDGRRLTLSGMNKKQAAAFIDRTINWCATELGLYIPPANPNWRNNEQQN